MNREGLLAFMNQSLEKAKSFLVKDGGVEPVAFLMTKGSVRVMPLVFEDLEEKRFVQAVVKAMAKNVRADAVVVVAEAWMAKCQKDEAEDFFSRSVSEIPGRVECIVVSGASASGNLQLIAEFGRDNEKVVFAGQNIMEGGTSEFTDGIWGKDAPVRSQFN